MRSTPRTSRGLVSGARLSRTRLARPAFSSISTSASFELVEIAARMIACSAPALISGASWAARWLVSVAA